MSTKSYDTLEGTLTVRGAATVSRTTTSTAVAIVGGYDANNADSSVTAGESTRINNPTTADEDLFGTSELPRAAQAVAANGAGPIYGVPVPETSQTETFTSTSSVTLSNVPVQDPRVHPDESITIAEDASGNGSYDTDVTTNVVYETTVSSPSDSNTANVNPITGDIEFDGSGDYEVQYTTGDYTTAIETAVDQPVRNVVVCTEAPSHKNTLQTELADRAKNFDFMRGFTGARPEIATADISSYSPDVEDWRMVEVAPARGEGADGEVRTAAVMGGFMAAQPIDPSGAGLYDSVNGITSLNTQYLDNEIKDFSQVTTITRDGVTGSVVTTSTVAQFEDVYAVEIIDDVTVKLFDTARNYAGGPQDVDELQTLLETVCQRAARGTPPQLGFGDGRDEQPYDVTVQLGATNDVADAGVTIVPHPIAKEVNLDITVSDGFVQFGGTS